jgi:pimeloyl-ACP methyl ester carboxylesterase
MATFVLVHGANVGGWCWRLVTPSLRYAGHEVYAPSLTGTGDRSHLLTPEVGLDTHVEDLASLLFHEDLDNVVLVGHSNGGAAVTGVAAGMPERVAHVVYLDAFVPHDGESLWQLIPEASRQWMEKQLGGAWKSPPAPPEAWVEMARAEGWNEIVARWAAARCGDWPIKASRDRLRIKAGEAFDKVPRTYVRCARSRAAGLDAMVERGSRAGWPIVELDTGHMAMLSAPNLVIDTLLRLAEPYGA